MTERAKISSAAEKFIERFGKDAPKEASKRAAELRDAGRADGSVTWMLICEEIEALLECHMIETKQ